MTASTLRSPLDLTKETRGEIVEFLEKVEQSGKWRQQACTTMFFLIPQNVTSERPIALMPTLIRWWEVLRALEVAKWQQKYRVDWNAMDGRNGGAQQTVWVILIEMERLNGKAKEEDQGALALVLDLAKEFGRVSLFVVWAWAAHFSFPRKILRVLCGYFEHQRRVQFEGCAGAANNHHGYPAKARRGAACFYMVEPCRTDRTDGTDRTRRTGQNWQNWRHRRLPGNKKNTSPHFQFFSYHRI